MNEGDLMTVPMTTTNPLALTPMDDELSTRELALDPAGYFIIYLDTDQRLICAKHYTTVIDDRGLACDPETGKPLPAKTAVTRTECTLYTGATAKALCIEVFEKPAVCPVTLPDHAAYLGREFMRAEYCLRMQQDYMQD
jgi:dihydropteroate synthase